MRISQVEIKNFRLLADVELVLEDQTTVIVGRNNSGKTSLSEVMRRLLSDGGINNQVQHPPGKVPRWASTTNN